MRVRTRTLQLARCGGAPFLLAGTLAALAACASDGSVAPATPCPAAVVVTVGTGSQPAVSWAPTCAVQSLTVVPIMPAGSVGLPLWQAQATSGGLMPPVQVGSRPASATVWGVGEALTLGATYTVYVGRGSRGAALSGVDSLVFTARAAP